MTLNAEYMRVIGEKVRSLRRSKDLTQSDLANQANISLSQVSRIERGIINTSLTQFTSIAEALGVHPTELLEGEDKLFKDDDGKPI